jgi:aspartate beta-hydroxylase
MPQSVALNPETARQANSSGLAAIRAGDAVAAIAALKLATAADPKAAPLWRNLAHAHRLAGDTVGERAALHQAIAIDRRDFVAQLRMAQLLQREGEEAPALVAWSGVQQLAAQLPELAEGIAPELDAGAAYCTMLRTKLYAASQSVTALASDFDETEQRRISAFVESIQGRRAVYQNDCAGAYYPFLPADEFFDRPHFPWFDQLEAGVSAIQAELAALLAEPGEALRPYVRLDAGTPQNHWSALDHSLDWSACFLWEYGEPNAPVIERCPQTAALLESLPLARIPGRAPNAFFSILRPGSLIPPHTGVTNTRAIVHLGLDIPPSCGFRVGGETREWVAGKAFAFDDTIEHEAWNHSSQQRTVLILDTWNPHLSERECTAISTYFASADGALSGSALA